MRRTPRKVRGAALGALTALAMAVPLGVTSTAHADTTTLNGDWAPFTRCPVDDSSMLAADGKTDIPLCVAAVSASGSIKLGNTEVPIGKANLQFGTVENTENGAKYSVVTPSGGVLVTAPATIPGGLLGLMCPSDIPVISGLCDSIVNSDLNRITATVEPAGDPSGFDLAAGMQKGKPIISIPVKVHLANPLLGDDCYIGSDSDPVVLKPQNLAAPTPSFELFNGDGTPASDGILNQISLTGADMGDSTFAVPGANGCGGGLLDWAVNLKTGLPSASGNNSIVLNSSSTYLAGFRLPGTQTPDAGKNLSKYWHSAAS